MTEPLRITLLILLGAIISNGFTIGVVYGLKFGWKSGSGYFRWAWIGCIAGFIATFAYVIVGYYL